MTGRRIGAVLAELQADFPDLTISKLRFLEAEGLVDPERTTSGYRLYAASDLERLRFILTAQRDHYWPLKIIREALDRLDRGLHVDLGPAADAPPQAVEPDPEVPDTEGLRRVSAERLTAGELATASGAGVDLVEELISFGLLRADEDGFFPGESGRIAVSAHELGRLGVEARHLRVFRTAAEREVGLVDYAASRPGAPDAAEVARACLALHTALVKDELARRR